MKKLKKIMIMLLTLLGLVSGNLINVNAASAPSTVTVKSKSNLYYFTEDKGTDYISGYNFYRKELTNGTLVYCVSNINTKVPAGKTMKLVGEIKDAGLSYIIENGYPYKSFTGTALKDYYITQSAIWEYFDETRGSNNWGSTSFKSSSTGMKAHVYNLVQAAKKAKKSEQATPSIDLIYINTTLNLKGDYFVSDPIRVNTEGCENTYTVTLTDSPKGTIIKGTDGKERTTFNNGEEFVIYVPSTTKSGSVSVSVQSSANSTKTYEYSSGESGVQTIGLVVSETTAVKKAATFKFEREVTKLKISKQDITSKEELPGATLVIKDSSGKEVDKWVSTNTPHYIEDLKEGNYALTETIAPQGYVLSTSTINFTLEADGKVKTVVMYNAKQEITKLKISKQDITSKEELPGATLVIKDKDGKEVDKWVSTTTPHYIEGLEEGNYTLTETIAPQGYILSSSTINFTLEADGKVKTVVMYNSKQETTKVKISKQDITSKEELPGATLVIKDSTGKIIDSWVSGNEPHYIEGLKEGEYTLSETIAPTGYKLSTETIRFTLKADGSVQSVVMYNEKYNVPITDLDVNQSTFIGAAVLMLLGCGLVFYAKREH